MFFVCYSHMSDFVWYRSITIPCYTPRITCNPLLRYLLFTMLIDSNTNPHPTNIFETTNNANPMNIMWFMALSKYWKHSLHILHGFITLRGDILIHCNRAPNIWDTEIPILLLPWLMGVANKTYGIQLNNMWNLSSKPGSLHNKIVELMWSNR